MRFRNAVQAEWTKLRTVAETRWLLLATVVLTITLSAATAASVIYHRGAEQDPTRISLTGIALGQALVAVLAVVTISAEHSTGMIGTTLAALPRRSTVLAAKAAVLSAVVLVAATIAVVGSVTAGRFLLPAGGFTAAHGHPPLALTHESTLRAAAGSALYLALIALLALGVATAVRDSAASIGVVLGLLYLFPVVTQVVDDPAWQRRLHRVAPMNAGLAIQSSVHLDDLPIGPWAGLAVVAAWAAAALLMGLLLLHLRDA